MPRFNLREIAKAAAAVLVAAAAAVAIAIYFGGFASAEDLDAELTGENTARVWVSLTAASDLARAEEALAARLRALLRDVPDLTYTVEPPPPQDKRLRIERRVKDLENQNASIQVSVEQIRRSGEQTERKLDWLIRYQLNAADDRSRRRVIESIGKPPK